MYAMSTCCRRWLLLSIIGSAIIVSIVAATDDGSNDKISDPPPVAELIKPKVVSTDAKDILGDRPISSPGDTVDELSKNDKVESIEGTKNDSRVVADLEKKAHSKGRALQGSDVGVFAVPDGMSHGKPDVTKNSLHGNITDLSDVSMDYDDKDIEGGEYLAIARNVTEETGTTCSYGNQTFSPGAVIRRGCSEKCVCGKEGKIQDCQPIVCSHPFFRAGRVIEDPLCGEKLTHEEPCCALLVCSQLDSEPEPEELCYLGDQTVQRGETIQDGCSRVCVCEAQGELKCRPRCTEGSVSDSMTTMSGSRATQRDKCVRVPDPKDSCCTIVLCDVTLGDHEIKSDAYVNLTRTEAINSTAVRLTFSNNLTSEQLVTVEMSTDNLIWKEVKVGKDGVIGGLAPSSTYYIRMHGDTDGANRLEEMRVTLPEAAKNGSVSTASTSSSMNATPSSLQNLDDAVCFHRGKSYKIDAEWYDECISFCTCSRPGVGVAPTTECATIECPTDFGLDVLDPHCLDWEMVPADFVPVAPRCCPQEVRCRNNGSCLYEGSMYNNWSEIPTNVTGCEKRCYCEMGNVSCQAACPPVPALPPANLLCPPAHAVLTHLPEDDCCLYWGCGNPANGSSLPATIGLDHGLPLGFPIHGGHGVQSSSDQVTVRILEAIADDRVRLVFTVPRVLVGLHGRVQVRYTSDRNKNSDPSTWKSQVFAPPDDLIATPQLEFELGGLRPSTVYRVMVTVKLRDLANSPSSEIREVTTFEASEPEVTLPPQVPTDAELVVTETNSTWANVMWKKFTEYELQFIDGVQLRYKEIEGKVYAATPLIHRAVTSYVIENLKPDVTYEVGIYFIPFPGQPTELVSERTLNFTTSSEPDPYSFAIKVEIKGIKATEVEVAWKGVPYPEDKYVNIYRAIYQSDTGKEDTSTFKIAKRDSPDRTIIGDLKPGTRYRLWIEVYLTNGRIKKSNVQDFVTKPGVPTSAGVVQGKSDNQVPQHEGDYYGPLVIVAIVASLAILSTLILLMLLMKRRTSSKADISPRKTTSAYDNPSYKTCEGVTTIASHRKSVENPGICEYSPSHNNNDDDDHRDSKQGEG